MTPLAIALGVIGLLLAAAAFAEVAFDSVRRRQYLDLALVLVLAVLVVWALIAFGDALFQ